MKDSKQKETRTPKAKTACGNLYIRTTNDKVFLTMGKVGGCGRTLLDALGSVINLAKANKIPNEKIVKAIKGYRCFQHDESFRPSCVHAVAVVVEQEIMKGTFDESCAKLRALKLPWLTMDGEIEDKGAI
jgi:hypothetical protein